LYLFSLLFCACLLLSTCVSSRPSPHSLSSISNPLSPHSAYHNPQLTSLLYFSCYPPWTGGVTQAVERLLCKCKALSSGLSPTKKKKTPELRPFLGASRVLPLKSSSKGFLHHHTLSARMQCRMNKLWIEEIKRRFNYYSRN
jgi:hypothetical protein